ncbi:hypothetical protein B0H17DRAFT_1032470 [Mycena rosella]|uniref:Uncharacterized protein n=1 Tax=Mycena rosella TaxID=1033263 RepID=A0AAD7MA40_MYCRO|nr:hypothetical protein B0H17DRAFT_1032470 [Mycena rosella]
MSSNRSPTEKPASSKPIPIISPAFPRGRPRSMSVSSGESSGSASSPTEIPTPMSSSTTSPRINIPSPGTSPILSYFLAQSPTKSPSTFPFRKFTGPAPVFEEEERDAKEVPAVSHARRASTAVAGRFAANPQNSVLPDAHNERGQGLLRRLSLSSGPNPFAGHDGKRSPPHAPPNTAVSPTSNSLPFGRDAKPRRAATLSVAEGRPRRAPSPMGERILKGHFDGFN